VDNYQSRVLRDGLSFGEAPRWHEGRLWYSDFYRHGVFSIDERGTEERLEHTVESQPSGLGWLPNGDMLCVSMTDYKVLRLHKGASTVFCDITKYCGFWANDMVTSSSGVSYVGNFGFDLDAILRDQGAKGLSETPPPTTNIVVIDSNGAVIQVVPKMTFPNGSIITPDGKTLIVGETLKFCLNAFDINHDGTLSNRRVWAQLDLVATDGMCLDADGQIWLANARTNQVLRVKEGGEMTAIVETTKKAYACMLGGSDQKTLYIMTAPTSDRFTIADIREGSIEVVSVPTRGAGRP
jgi:sugar lactone lactonase YvrE